MYLRRGNIVKKNIPDKNIVAGIRNGKLVASDEVSFDGKIWEPLGEHPSFCGFFGKTQPSFTKKPEAIQNKNAAGLFRKLFAFFVDFLIVVSIFTLAKEGLSNMIADFEEIRRFILFSMAILYFSLFENGLTKGKTFGKLVMSISVVDNKGGPLSPGASLLRAGFFFLPVGLLFGTSDLQYTVKKIAVIPDQYIAVFCFAFFSIFYTGNLFFALFHPQKRGLHDIISSSFVAYRESGIITLRNFSDGSVIAAFIGSVTFGLGVGGVMLAKTSYFDQPQTTISEARSVEMDKEYNLNRMQATDWPGWTDLHRAVARGDLKEATRLIDSGMAVDTREEGGATALYEASRRGNIDIMKYLLNKGADVNAPINDLFTPLHVAAEYHQADAMRLLIKNGADVNARDDTNITPLRQAAAQAWHEDGLMAEILVDAGADMTIRSNDGCIPIYCAITSNNMPFVAYLLKKGADPNTKRGDWSILQHAVWRGKFPMVQLLLDYKPNINYSMPEEGTTVLMTAIKNKHWDIAKLLLKHNPNIHAIDKGGRTAYRWAELHENEEMMQIIKKHETPAKKGSAKK